MFSTMDPFMVVFEVTRAGFGDSTLPGFFLGDEQEPKP